MKIDSRFIFDTEKPDEIWVLDEKEEQLSVRDVQLIKQVLWYILVCREHPAQLTDYEEDGESRVGFRVEDGEPNT